MISEQFQVVIQWYMEHINYFSITLLMTIESSFIPFPSEVIIPPAAWKAAKGELSIVSVVLFSSLGALLGALFNYYIALYLGKKVLYRLADTRFMHMLLVDRKSIEKAENYFLKYGNISTFIGRLLPAVRQLISLPAGLAKMGLKNFIIYTTLGATIWNIILAILGYYLYSQKELLEKYYKELSYGFLFLGVLVFVYMAYNGLKKTKPSAP